MNGQIPALRLEGIVKTFPGVRALDGVSFDVMPGEVHALMGENGAGKSTLMKVLGGIYQPDSGEIIVNETIAVMTSPLEAKAKGILFIHQELSLAQELSVAENVYLGELPLKRFGRIDWATLYEKTDAILARLNVGFNSKTIVGTMSIANQQMVEIARALATEPDFIMLDEPFAGVDPISVIDIKEIINHLRDRGIGVLITDHNVRDTLDICEKAYIVGEGRIIASGTAEDVLNNEHVRKVYLGEQFRM